MAPISRVLGCGLALVIFAVGCLPSRVSAMGLPRPQPNLNFTIGVEGVVWCKGCRYRGYIQSRDASPLRNVSALLRCRHGRRRALSVWGATNSRGYFLIETGAQAAPFTSKDCRVYVPRSPARGCRVDVSPGRNRGLPLRFRRFVTRPDGLQGRYVAGSFTFAPQTGPSADPVNWTLALLLRLVGL
ncbi:non-classical arabinogalactan protein 31 [Setaria italica]|uniref:Non-classical arabinogalactan protein 30 n=1 Tax=Setaria italica TaxID=4555 RepID=K3XTE5_SETIT|nr:non-classical arabinogalactan protein 31 [Setaria italica]